MIDLQSALTTFITEFWHTLTEMSPYLLFGFLIAGLLSVFISASVVQRHLGGTGLWPLLKASLFGVPLPLCSCGVIPVSMSLRKHGASKGATIAFLLSTPQTGVDSILVTYSLLGPVFAIFRPLIALITGLIGGSLTEIIDKDTAPQQHNENDHEDCCGPQKKPAIIRAFKYGFVTLPRDIAPAMLIGLIIAGMISAAVPDDFFAPLLGGGLIAMIVMMLLGIPVYVCATASVPIAAALMAKGISPGVAFVFLMTGPATNAATFTTIWSVLGKKTAIVYIATVAACAVGFGMMLDWLTQNAQFDIVHKPHWMIPPWIGTASAIILIALLTWAIITKLKPKKP